MRSPADSARRRAPLRLLGPLLGIAFGLAACGGGTGGGVAPDGAGMYKVGKPYRVGSTWYYPKLDLAYVEEGVASWYGPGFHGRSTANGERFDQNALTAAHRTLPLPSAVQVTNLENGRTVVLRVNDRGPFAHGRIIDVSRRAAQLLGFATQGVARVRVAILPEESIRLAEAAGRGDIVAAEPPPPPPPRPTILVSTEAIPEIGARPAAEPVLPTSLYVQIGAYSDPRSADRVATTVTSQPLPAQVTRAGGGDGALYRVRLGPFASPEEAEIHRSRVAAAGFADARLVKE